ncbi:hypothetical protein [Microbispora sp. ATCC PTA-5024]|uniref:hypothetical protein n=1 Tax=Microbispora sp. ATCC PTA-5024 TaxID=316330 RepID=UPI0018DC39DD|nr:hypothetical protein [Microbispora sp. ATCC PTA-5024]
MAVAGQVASEPEHPGVVVDPAVPAPAAGLLRAHEDLLTRLRSGAAARRCVRLLLAAALWPVLALTVLVLLVAHPGPLVTGLVAAPAGAGIYGAGRAAARRGRVRAAARRYDGRYLLPPDFDGPALALLGRARGAVRTVLSSRVGADGLLDDVRDRIALPAEEWEVARLLAALSALRAEHAVLVADGTTPEVRAAAKPLERALRRTEAAVAARVEALERYAGRVAGAERAYAARGQIEGLRDLIPRYEELLAASAGCADAAGRIDAFAAEAGRLEAALRAGTDPAPEAFRYLDGRGDGPAPSGEAVRHRKGAAGTP